MSKEKEEKKIRMDRFIDDGDGLIITYPNKDDEKKHESVSFTDFYYNMIKNEEN